MLYKNKHLYLHKKLLIYNRYSKSIYLKTVNDLETNFFRSKKIETLYLIVLYINTLKQPLTSSKKSNV